MIDSAHESVAKESSEYRAMEEERYQQELDKVNRF